MENKCREHCISTDFKRHIRLPERRSPARLPLERYQDFLVEHDLEVYLAVFDKAALAVSEKLLGEVESYIDEHYVSEHQTFLGVSCLISSEKPLRKPT